jgi:hypothetical protein
MPADPGSVRAGAEPPDVRNTPPARGRILVIDEFVGESGHARILGHHHDVITVGDVAAALALVRGGEAFDAVFCDLMPTGMVVALHGEVEPIAPGLARGIVYVDGLMNTPALLARVVRAGILRLTMPLLDEDCLLAVEDAMRRSADVGEGSDERDGAVDVRPHLR